MAAALERSEPGVEQGVIRRKHQGAHSIVAHLGSRRRTLQQVTL